MRFNIFDCPCKDPESKRDCPALGGCKTRPCDLPAVGKARGLWMCEEHLDATMDGEEWMSFGEEAEKQIGSGM